jgi:hypothetical protein
MLLTIAWLALATAAPAAELYVGGSGSSPMESRVGRDFQMPDADLGFDVRAGFEGSVLGVEVAWHDLGDVRWCQDCFDAGGSASTKVWSVGLTVGKTFSSVRPFLKLGYFHATTDGAETSLIGPITIDEDDDGIFGEVGLRAFLGRHLALRAGYERFDFGLEDDGAFPLGAEIRF